MFSVFFCTWEINRILPDGGNLLCFIMLSVVVTDMESELISFTESGITKSTEHGVYCALHKHVSSLKPFRWSFLHNIWFVHKFFIFLQHRQAVRARSIQKYMIMFQYLQALRNLCFQQCTE